MCRVKRFCFCGISKRSTEGKESINAGFIAASVGVGRVRKETSCCERVQDHFGKVGNNTIAASEHVRTNEVSTTAWVLTSYHLTQAESHLDKLC